MASLLKLNIYTFVETIFMPAIDKRIDAYIESKADFAKLILKHLRQLVHKACPDAQETIKWGMPFFDYKENALCCIAAFKEHCTFAFWKAKLMKDPEHILQVAEKHAMGNFDRITSLKDLPSDKILIAYIKEAAKLNEDNVKLPARKKAPITNLKVPADFAAALKKNKKAYAVFENFTPGKRKEYIEWITEAKTEPTKIKRIETAVEWIAEGKSRNWRYEKS
ncbi:MAG TPA: YdeI/OmpD-associated family protein [Parafilimonas sp.]